MRNPNESFKEDLDILTEEKGEIMVRIVTIVLVVVLVIFLFSSMYVVDQTEQVVVTQFGKPVRVILNPIEGRNKDQILRELKDKYATEEERGATIQNTLYTECDRI